MTNLHTYIANAETSTAVEEISKLTRALPHELIAQDENGNSPLHLAIQEAHTEIAIALIDALL